MYIFVDLMSEITTRLSGGRRSWLRMSNQTDTPIVDILEVAQEALAGRPVNGTTGRVQKRLHELYQGRPLSIDSAATAVRLSAWRDEADKARLETLFHYGLCEAFNYNAAVMSDQIGVQGGAISNLEESCKNKAVIPDIGTELSLLTYEKLEIERPGFLGEIIDMRAIAATVNLTGASTTDRWRQMARDVLDKVLPKVVQVVYSASSKASMYFALPPEFVDAIVQCCAISSDLNEADSATYLPAIASHVRTALGFKLNEIKKGRSKDINELVREAVAVGWTPPGVTREEACALYLAGTSDEPIKTEDDLLDADIMASADAVGTAEILPNPTAHLKRRGPINTRKSERKKAKNDSATDLEAVLADIMPGPSIAQPLPIPASTDWYDQGYASTHQSNQFQHQ